MSKVTSVPAVEAIIGGYAFRNDDLLWNNLHAPGARYAGEEGMKAMALIGNAVLRLVLVMDLTATGATRGSINNTITDTVSNKNLARVCVATNLINYIVGNPSHVGQPSPGTCADAMEAILGAVYIDSGNSHDAVRAVMNALGLSAPSTTTGTG